MASTSAMCWASSLLLRLASNSQAGCSCSSAAEIHISRHFRGFAVAAKATKDDPSKKKKTGQSGGPDGDNPRLKLLVSLLSSPERKEVKLSEQELAADAEYRKALEAEHDAWAKDMKVKFQLQQEALRALPERLRLLAKRPDHTAFPMNRKFLFDTPPESYRDGSGSQEAKRGTS